MQDRRLIDIIAPNAKNISLCMLFLLVFWYDLFLLQTESVTMENIRTSVQSPLFFLIEQTFPFNGIWEKIAGLILYLLLGFEILRLNEVFSFIRTRTILPSFFFLIIGSLLLPHSFSPGIIIALLVLSSVFFSFKLLTEENPKYAFNVSLLLFTAVLFSLSCIWLLIIFWLFAYTSNVLSFRIFLASLLGALVPPLYAAIGFGIAGNEHLLLEYIQESFQLFAVDFHFSLPEILYMIIAGFLISFSLVDFLLVRSKENIKPRKEFSYLVTLLLFTLVLIIFSVPDSGILLWLPVVFGSFLLGRFFSLKNNRFTQISLSIFLGSSLLLLFFS